MSYVVSVELPSPLCRLASAPPRLQISFTGPPTQRGLLDAIERDFPMLQGTLRDPRTGIRRPFIRFFSSREDLSSQSPDEPLPDAVLQGLDPLLIIGAIAGG